MSSVRQASRLRQTAISAAACALILGAWGGSAAGQESPSKKRGPPPPTPSLVARGIRYQAIEPGAQADLDPYAGYVAATIAATGRRLWITRIYDGPTNAEIEDDKRAVFISRLTGSEHGHALVVTDERGRRYRLDLTTRAVNPIPSSPSR